METIIRKSNVFLILILVGFISCNSDNTIFDTYKTLDNGIWKADDPIEFSFLITDTISRNNVFINLRNNNAYSYSNLYVIANLNFPDGRKIVDTLQYRMTDNEGNFLGSGFSEIKENKLFYKEQKTFPMSGEYSVSIWQAMRKNGEIDQIKELKGISDIGLKIEKIE
ncbi:gliding motility lipoprotein GldH [Flavobacteriaceae bacterium S356]|uniref:Gliding motility lipoprotein GldH n=1 Tax=Asprobacillus argus TaxID=3076534 RepID=A0ABU3LC88_9FLAO|nr:gliding motility lipoprotein GldH [Flavobacteriaceae bacterium S356]